MTIKKPLNTSDSENTIVHAIFVDPRDLKQEEYESVCTLTNESAESVTLAFNAKDDVVVDFLEVKKKDIVSIEVLEPSIIKNI